MKHCIKLLLPVVLAVASCGPLEQTSSRQMFQDGIYYRPTPASVEILSQEDFRKLAADNIARELAEREDSPALPEQAVSDGGNITINIIDPWTLSFGFCGYWGWNPWRYGFYSPWYWNHWHWSDWYWYDWYWGYPFFDMWMSPWYGGFYPWYGGYYPWYGGYYPWHGYYGWNYGPGYGYGRDVIWGSRNRNVIGGSIATPGRIGGTSSVNNHGVSGSGRSTISKTGSGSFVSGTSRSTTSGSRTPSAVYKSNGTYQHGTSGSGSGSFTGGNSRSSTSRSTSSTARPSSSYSRPSGGSYSRPSGGSYSSPSGGYRGAPSGGGFSGGGSRSGGRR